MEFTVHNTWARLDDESALAALVAPIPRPELVKRVLKGGESHHVFAFSNDTHQGFYIMEDGSQALCFTINDISWEQAVRIDAACGEIYDWSVDTFKNSSHFRTWGCR